MMVGQSKSTATQIRDVLVVDTDLSTAEALKPQLGTTFETLRTAQSTDQAELEMKRRPADVLMINVQIGDQRGLELVTLWRRAYPNTDVIALSRTPRAEVCLAAWQAGASDMLLQPVNHDSVQKCLGKVLERRTAKERQARRQHRLRQTCRQLSKARKEIGAQVDLLCHDLVKAYQDMAQQLHQTQMSGEYAASLGQDLDMENMMRATMQYILKKSGSVNAAVFLPDSEKNFVLGAFLDLDTDAKSMLTEVMAQTVVPHAAAAKGVVEFLDNAALDAAFSQPMLHNRSWMAVATYHKGEPMAVVLAFRHQKEPFPQTVRPALESIAAVLGEKIARLVNVHNRCYGPQDKPEAD